MECFQTECWKFHENERGFQIGKWFNHFHLPEFLLPRPFKAQKDTQTILSRRIHNVCFNKTYGVGGLRKLSQQSLDFLEIFWKSNFPKVQLKRKKTFRDPKPKQTHNRTARVMAI